MKERRVRFTQTAAQHVSDEHAWWSANRDHQGLFATELEDAGSRRVSCPPNELPLTSGGRSQSF